MIKRNPPTSNSNSDARWKTTPAKPRQLEKRKRLATLMPTFDSGEVIEAEIEAELATQLTSDSRSQTRLPVIAPFYEAANLSIENEPLPLLQEVINTHPQPPTITRHQSRFKAVAFLCSFAMVIGGFIGVFAYHIPESQNSHEAVAKTVDSHSPQSPAVVVTDHSVPDAPRSQPAVAPIVILSLTKPSVAEVRKQEKVEPAEEVHQEEVHQEEEIQLVQEANQEQELEVTQEPQVTAEAAALVARVEKLLGVPTENIDKKDVPLPEVPPVLAQNDPPEFKKPIEIAAIQKLSANQLRTQLQTETPSVDLLQNKREFINAKLYIRKQIRKFQKENGIPQKSTPVGFVAAIIQKPAAAANASEHEPFEPLINHLFERDDLLALPLTMDDQCRVSDEETLAIKAASNTLGRLLSEASSGPLGAILRNSSNAGLRSRKIKERQQLALLSLQSQLGATTPESQSQFLKTTDQILQVQHRQDRLEFVNLLKDNDNNSTATNLLAKRVKYDLSADVRMAATNALAEFPRDQYRTELLAGLKYPWHIVAQHSAEALVRLDDKEAIPELVEMLDLPHPNAPVEIKQNEYVQPTLVAINHMRNCLLCHAPSQSTKDIVTGTVPNWEQRIPVQSYANRSTEFISVRADITYLKQDFSVIQPIANHGLWPDTQRFDYVVQQTPLKRSKANQTMKRIAKTKNLNREAIVFALQKLTNQSPEDNSAESWKAILEKQNALIAQH